MRQSAVIPLLVAATLTGCGFGDWAQNVGGSVNPASLGLGDRCAALMKAAIPYADLDIGKRTSENKGISLIAAHVEAARIDHSNDPGIGRDLTADCEFDNAALVSFHLTGLNPGH
jgi:hypothetical protein